MSSVGIGTADFFCNIYRFFCWIHRLFVKSTDEHVKSVDSTVFFFSVNGQVVEKLFSGKMNRDLLESHHL